MNWKTELASALRRLEAELPHLNGLRSVVAYGDSVGEIESRRVGPVKLKGPSVIVGTKANVRPFRMVLFSGTIDRLRAFSRHAVELSVSLEEFRHPRIGAEWAECRRISGDSFAIGLIEWTMAMHQFAKTTPDVELLETSGSALLRPDELDNQRIWYPKGAFVSLIEEPATVSAKFADWIVNTEGIGLCPVELLGENRPPVIHGKSLPQPLSEHQYAVMRELIRRFPNGLMENELVNKSGVEHPRHVLMTMMGKRQRIKKTPTKQQKLWANIILPPGGHTGLGWRLKGAD